MTSDLLIEAALAADEPAMNTLLRQSIEHQSISGQEGLFTGFIEHWARVHDFTTDLWETDDAVIAAHPCGSENHLPLRGRPTLVIGLPGAIGPLLMFNAHADVVAADETGWSAHERDGVIFGRGACDVKGPLIAALWAMRACQRLGRPFPNVKLELVPGEEDCVGVGTLTSVLRGYRADAVIVLEPTELQPRCASRGGLRFEVRCAGKAVHGTVKWLGTDAIRVLREVLDALDALEQRWNDQGADPLFAMYPFARPITVDRVAGGRWQGMVCDEALCAGYLELLPDDDLKIWGDRFVTELSQSVGDPLRVLFTEEYRGHRLSADHPLMAMAEGMLDKTSAPAGFNSGCEAGLRALVANTPTLVWGPGTLAHAHSADERIAWADVRTAAHIWTQFIGQWSNSVKQ